MSSVVYGFADQIRQRLSMVRAPHVSRHLAGGTEAIHVRECRPIGPGRMDMTFDTHFSQGFVADGFIFVSGQMPADTNGALVGEGHIEQQARKVFENIRGVLEEEGASLSDVVQLTVFLLDIGDIPRIAPVRREFFGDHRPSSTAVEVSALLLPGARLEVNAIALRGAPARRSTADAAAAVR
jgi:2-iminobutanoate/2-iminopropanoate deaminase